MSGILYNFKLLKNYLCRIGFEVFDGGVYSEIVHELSVDEQLHNIDFTSEGVIYTDKNGNRWLGFVYKKYKALGKGNKDDYPRMHLCHCGVTDTWGEEAYMFANTIPIRCYNTSDNNKEKQISNILMCKTCISMRKRWGWNTYRDAKQYVAYIKHHYKIEESQEVNRWGYAKDWHQVRKAYMEEQKYTCEKCGQVLDSVIGRTFLHVYHIDQNLANNKQTNLECLCTCCYCKSLGVERTESLIKQLYSYNVYLGKEQREIYRDDTLTSQKSVQQTEQIKRKVPTEGFLFELF